MKKILATIITLFSMLVLCSCPLLCGCEKDFVFPQENCQKPENNSIVKYEFENGYVLTLLFNVYENYYSYNDFLFYGELQTENETLRMDATVVYQYDTCLLHGRGEMGFDLILCEIEGLTTSNGAGLIVNYPEDYSYENNFATFDAGILNSTKLILNPSGEEWKIVNITTEKSTFDYWDWNDPTWSEYYTYGETTHYIAEDIGLSYHAWRNMGEMEIGGEKHPVKLIFHEESMTISVYDMSNNRMAFIMSLTGHMDKENADKFIVDEIDCAYDFQYADDFSNLSGIEIYKTELTEN